MIHIRSSIEVDRIHVSGQIVKETLEMLEEYIKPDAETLELDSLAEKFIRNQGAIPGFKGLYGFPATLCISIDDEVVHGIPGKRILKKGQIVSIDVGAYKDNYYGDHARSFAVGNISKAKQQLLDVTRESLYKGIEQAIPGNRIGDIGHAVQKHAEKYGYGVVRQLVGHGIGTKLHEEPQIPNFGKKGTGAKIEAGMCFAIEPMINMGTPDVYTKEDNWTVCTQDNKPAAHFEHTITITNNGPRILTN
ncbi:MAG: type I methionyl aminopeptidase [Candidatus Marinimicrobia bacterium]|jgi:methionyl aminopeptidase|nr:type I methionyl aminopeptidase [Candidatus Neomarinimicrobiota bacterium]MBT3683086.1 type I methionyl aminopeptidase [Candidatus Neomarinimicrobiota bacterium]MBT3759822.1 type I methionyl aminopeptidase [Candidatus Neomarinimicrobiota bacterium]MBT3895725.1 type I methionyl aminopeptidase [Candidatus Neomarinimicrobiota bacterium]MBT4173236.1 type I methionyl aminopeptidase [Candidatus Neomarinimicrobiota bacterium]